MAKKESSDKRLNFGPEWLQNLSQPQESNTSLNSNNKPRVTTATKCQLAEYRYGREEMLALFDANAAAPDYLIKHEELYVANIQLPIALQNDMDELKRYPEPRISSTSITGNRPVRDSNFRQDARTRPPRNFSTYGGKPASSGRANFFYYPDRHGPNPPPTDHMFRPSSGRATYFPYWRRDGPGNTEPWRPTDSNQRYRGSGRVSWRDNDEKINDLERRPQVRRIRKPNAEEDPGDAPSLPEWAETDNVGGYSGSFDASGAYTESNLGDTKESENKEKQEEPEDISDDVVEEKSIEQLSKAIEEIQVEELEKNKTPDENPGKEKEVDVADTVEPTQSASNSQLQSVKEVSQDSAKSNDAQLTSFVDIKPFTAPVESDEVQQNGCGALSDNINSLLNWVLEENIEESRNKPAQTSFTTDQRDISQREILANVERREVLTNFDRVNTLSEIERRMKMEPMNRNSHSVDEALFNNPMHLQSIDLNNMLQTELGEGNNANKLSKFIPVTSHLNPFPQSSTPSQLNPAMMPLYQPLQSDQPWTNTSEDNNFIGDNISLWDERQLELAKQITLQRQQDALQSRQINISSNLAQELVLSPQLPRLESQPAVPDTTIWNFLNPFTPRTSFYDEILQGAFQNTPRPQNMFDSDTYNYYLRNSNNVQTRTEPLSVEDVYRNSLNFQMQNQLLSAMDGGLQSNMNFVSRNDVLQLLQNQQQQQQQLQQQTQPTPGMFVPQQPQQVDVNLTPPHNHPFTMVDTPTPLSFLNIPPPPLPQPIPMPERRASQMVSTTNNVAASTDLPPPAMSTSNESSQQPQVIAVEEQPTNTNQDISNFEVVKKKDKKAKKKNETDSESSKKKMAGRIRPKYWDYNGPSQGHRPRLESFSFSSPCNSGSSQDHQQAKQAQGLSNVKSPPVANQPPIQQQVLQQQMQQHQLQLHQLQQQQQLQQLQRQTQTQVRQPFTPMNPLEHDYQMQQARKLLNLSPVNTKPKVSRPAPWLMYSAKESASDQQAQMSLTQIQRLEKEQQRKAQILLKAQQALSEQTTQKEKETAPWVNLHSFNTQWKETRPIGQPEINLPSPAPPAPADTGDRMETKLSKIGGIWGPPEASSSVWNFNGPQLPSSGNNAPAPSQKQQQKPAAEESKKVQRNSQPKEDPDELNTWAKRFLKHYEHKLDVEAFLSFIKNIESPYEVKEYIKFYLGDTKETMDYCEDYIEKRLEINRRKNLVIPADDLSAPAAAVNPAMNADNPESKIKHKKNKKRMSKIDSRILGFNVTAAADRFNIGDIASIEKP